MNSQIGSSGDRVVGAFTNCKHPHIEVIQTWRAGQIVRRRRQCRDCGETFLTSENIPIRTNANNRTGLRVSA